MDVFVLSFPNLCEAVIGGLLLSNIGLFIKHNFLRIGSNLTEKHICIIAVLVTVIYTLLQETKVHSLGGNKIYDPFDILFSMIGLVTVYFILLYIKPVITFDEKTEQ